MGRLSPFRDSARATWAALRAAPGDTVYGPLPPLFVLGHVGGPPPPGHGCTVLLFFLAEWAFLVLPRTLIFPWYLPPLLLPYSVLGGVGFASAAAVACRNGDTAGAAARFLCRLRRRAALHTGHWLYHGRGPAVGDPVLRGNHPQADRPVAGAEHAAGRGRRAWSRSATSATTRSGTILDEVGLVSPEVIPFNRRGAGWFTGVVKTYRPDYIVERPYFLMANKTLNTGVAMFASPAERDWFWEHYRRVRELTAPAPQLSDAPIPS